MLPFCKHEWEKIAEQTMLSAVEQLGGVQTYSSAPAWVFQKTYILVLSCKKCGKINKTVASNP